MSIFSEARKMLFKIPKELTAENLFDIAESMRVSTREFDDRLEQQRVA
jgi:hypothetical protein